MRAFLSMQQSFTQKLKSLKQETKIKEYGLLLLKSKYCLKSFLCLV